MRIYKKNKLYYLLLLIVNKLFPLKKLRPNGQVLLFLNKHILISKKFVITKLTKNTECVVTLPPPPQNP